MQLYLKKCFTWPAGGVAQYCDKRVCVCVCLSDCLSASISPERNAPSLSKFLCMLPMAVARYSSDKLTKSKGHGQFWGFSFLLTMHCKAFAAERIIPYRPGRG